MLEEYIYSVTETHDLTFHYELLEVLITTIRLESKPRTRL